MARSRSRVRIATFPTRPWKWDVIVLHGGSSTDLPPILKSIGIDEEKGDDGQMGHAWVHLGKPVVVWTHDLADIPTLVHELIHAVFGMLEARGLRHSEASEEAYTYTVEDLLRRILAAKKWARA